MYRLVTLTLAILLVSPAASGQIEMTSSSGGNVGIGVAPLNSAQLYIVNDTGGVLTYGLRSESTGSSKGYGVYARSVTIGSYSFGVYGIASGGNNSYGVYGYASATTGQTGYGIYGNAASQGGTKWAGYFSGDVHATGDITEGSDAMFKENIRPLEGEEDSQGRSVLERFEFLQPVAYTFSRDAQFGHMNLPEGEQFGLISQDVETVFPELVSEVIHPAEIRPGPDGEPEEVGEEITYKGLNYIHLVPILVHVVQKQQAEIDELRALMEELMAGGN